MGFVLLALVCLAPLCCVFLLNTSMKWLSPVADERGSHSTHEVISVPKISYGADLRRIGDEYQRLLTTDDVPGRDGRLLAVERQYDDTLRAACQALELEVPAGRLDAGARVQVEADLMLHGMQW